jgi:hypothetical protein
MAELIDVVTGQPVKFSCLTDLPERQQFRTVNGEFVCRLTPTLVQFGGTRLFQSLSLSLSLSLCVCVMARSACCVVSMARRHTVLTINAGGDVDGCSYDHCDRSSR